MNNLGRNNDTFVHNKSFQGNLSFSNIRSSRLVYFMAYALELIFFALRGQFLPVGLKVLGINGWTIIQAAHMVASLIVMLLWSSKFKPLLRGSALIMLLGFIPYIFLPIGTVRFVFGLIGYIGLGGVVTGARCGYAFASNNSERLFGIILMYFAVMFIRLIKALGFSGIVMTCILPLIILAALFICVFKFKEEDFEVNEGSSNEDAKGLYWALAFFIAYFAIDGYIGELTDSSLTNEYMFLIAGFAITGILLVAVICGLKISTWHLWNFFFICAIGMGAFAVLAPTIGSLNPEYFFAGMSYMGWPLCIYTLGCAQRRFASYKLLKKCTLIYVVLSPFTTLSSDWVANFAPNLLPVFTLVFTVAIAVVMFMLSPISYNRLFSSLWISEIYQPDMGMIKEKVDHFDLFEGYELTPRQKEIAVLLLAAKTRRQIAAELGLSESTVKMHISELYKRLNINSKTELFKIFGMIND